jgi:hypothetical protein
MATPVSADLRRRGALIRRLLRYREMLPGSLVFTRTRCGKARCRCAQGGPLHPVCQLVARVDGRTRTIYIPEDLIPWVQERFRQHQAFLADAALIGRINLELLAAKKARRRDPAATCKGR